MDIHSYQWGTDVYCGDEICGKLSRVVVDPKRGAVTDLVVEQGVLKKKAWVVSQRHVEQATADGIWLDLSQEELAESQPYRRRVVEEVAPGYSGGSVSGSPTSLGVPDVGAIPMVSHVVHDGVASDEMRVLKQGVMVRDAVEDKTVGKLKQVVVDAESGEIAQLTVQKGLLGEDITLQPTSVLNYDEDRIMVQNVGEPVGTEVREPQMAATGDQPAPSLPLHSRVEQALDEDPRTRDEAIEVVEQNGIVTLMGEVKDVDASHAAQEIAGQQPGVVSVQNGLIVRR